MTKYLIDPIVYIAHNKILCSFLTFPRQFFNERRIAHCRQPKIFTLKQRYSFNKEENELQNPIY